MDENEAQQGGAEQQEGAETTQPMSLEELIASAQDAGKEKLEAVAARGTEKPKPEKGPRKITTAEAFANALELIGEGTFVTVKGVTAIMEHQGWSSDSRTEREKFIAVKSAIYNRKRAGEQNPKMALPIDWSKSRDGLFAYKPIVDQDEAEGAEAGDADPKPEDIPTE